MFLSKAKLSTIKVLISKTLSNLYINHDELISISALLREYDKIKDKIKNSENAVKYTMYKQWKRIVSVVKKYLKKNSVRRTKQNGLKLLSNCAVCGQKNSRLIKY